MKLIIFFFLLSSTSLFVVADDAAPAKATPAPAKKEVSAAAKKQKEELQNLFELTKKVNSPNASEKSKARASIDQAMDWDRIAKSCLGAELWGSTSPGNRQKFHQLLKEVIVLSAYTRLDKFWGGGVTYTIDDFELTGPEPVVTARYNLKDSSEVQIQYYLNKKGSKWTIFDIAYEGEQYSKNIHEQIEAFMGEKKNFNLLLEKLQKKKADLLEDEKGGGKASKKKKAA